MENSLQVPYFFYHFLQINEDSSEHLREDREAYSSPVPHKLFELVELWHNNLSKRSVTEDFHNFEAKISRNSRPNKWINFVSSD